MSLHQLPPDMDAIKKLATEKGITENEVLLCAIQKEVYINDVIKHNGKVLIEKEGGKIVKIEFKT